VRWAGLGAIVGLLLAACGTTTPAPALPLPTLPPLASATAADMVAVVIGPATATPETVPLATPFALLLGQRLSASGSFTMTETEAAGPMVCQIKRDSCAFGKLVLDRNPDLLYSEGEDPPYGAEDRMMHPAMVRPLARLAELVRAEWGAGVQVMVTEAYDSLLDHNLTQPNRALRYSLHFEGRSADLITWPPDESRNGRLCVLALEAGFDWVWHEGDHCHASIRADSLCLECSPTTR
jgi:hypothetical protein